MTTAGGGIELAQVWVPLMPEASGMAKGVRQIAADAEKTFGRSGKVLGASLSKGVESGSRKILDTLKQVEQRTIAVEKATKAQADAVGRVEVAEKRLNQVKANSKSTDLQRASAQEAYNRAQRTEELTKKALTRTTNALTSAEKDLAAAKKASADVKLPLGARLAAQAEQQGADSGQKFVTGFKRGLGTLSGLALGGGLIAAARSMITAGVDMESNLNRLQGVTNATAKEMASAAAEAQRLGADTTIVGASAADAAAAMLELAKGGLTMQQSLAAAPGTLRLAAAASVDAATAAESQATILNSFQLSADQADHVADALANVANAAQGEVPDFMLGLQQASAVAHGFGISMEETVAILGLFAKAGIRGSDAGTSMKTMLTHLANPSDQASAAMDRLGLSIHDAQGNFVGMRELFRQIGDASKTMRPDDFQEAVAKVFGTDAIRGAMIAGNQGIDTLDQMRKAVDEVGGASKMAAANMKGLPGTIEKAKNAADTAKLAFYDLVKPLLQSGGEKAVDMLNGLAAAFHRMQSGGIFAGFNPATTGIVATIGAIYLKSKLTGPAIAGAAKATDMWTKAFGGWKTAAKDASDGMDYVRMATGDTLVQQRGWATQMRDSYRTAADGAERFHRSAGFAGAAMSGMKSAGSGLLSVLGGPWGVAAAGVTAAIGLIAAKHAEAAQAAAAQKAAEEGLMETLSAGRATEQTKQQISAALSQSDSGPSAAQRAQSFNIDPNQLLKAAMGDQGSRDTLLANLTANLGKAADNNAGGTTMQGVLAKAGVGREELAKALSKEGFNWDVVTKKLRDYNAAQLQANKDYKPAISSLQDLINVLPDYAESAVAMNQAVNQQALTATQAAKAWELQNQTMNGTWEATKEGVDRFADLGAAIVAVPSDKQIVVNTLTDDAKKKLEELGYKVDRLPNGNVVVTAATDEALERIHSLVQKVEDTRVDVHLNPIWGDLGSGHAAAAARAALGEVTDHGGRAGGGFVDSRGVIHGPGTGTSDSILARVLGGRGGLVRVANNESINTARSTRNNWPLIDAMNKGVPPAEMLAKMMGYSDGGLIDAAEAMIGHPYSQATRWDCSGSVARLINAALGDSGGGLMTTKNAADWLAARGFQPGIGPAGSLSIGWYDKGGPNSGHMAATLPDGRNFEQGGRNGVLTIGAGASGADDPQFTSHMFLPADDLWAQGDGGSGGSGSSGSWSSSGGSGPTRAESISLRNAQQKIDDTAATVATAQASLDELNAKGTATAKQRETAETRLARAQREHQDAIDDFNSKQDEVNQKVADREARSGGKDTVGSKSSGPDAKSFGQSMLSGALEALGFDGEIFSDPTQWGIFKTGTGIANLFGGVLKNWNWKGFSDATDGGNDLMKPWRRKDDPNRTQHGVGGSPGPGNNGDGGLGDFQFGGGGGGGGVDVLRAILPDVGDFLPNSQEPGTSPFNRNTNNTTTNSNVNSHNTTGMVFNGPVTMNQPVQQRPVERMNTRTSGLPK